MEQDKRQGVICSSYIRPEVAEWIANEAAKRRWSRSLFISVALQEAMARESAAEKARRSE